MAAGNNGWIGEFRVFDLDQHVVGSTEHIRERHGTIRLELGPY